MVKVGEAFHDARTGVTRERSAVEGRLVLGRDRGAAHVQVPRAEVEFAYTSERVVAWMLLLPVDGATAAGLRPFLEAAGMSEDELLDLAPGERCELALAARSEVLERLGAELAQLSSLSAMLMAGDTALLDLDNYVADSCRVLGGLPVPGEETGA